MNTSRHLLPALSPVCLHLTCSVFFSFFCSFFLCLDFNHCSVRWFSPKPAAQMATHTQTLTGSDGWCYHLVAIATGTKLPSRLTAANQTFPRELTAGVWVCVCMGPGVIVSIPPCYPWRCQASWYLEWLFSDTHTHTNGFVLLHTQNCSQRAFTQICCSLKENSRTHTHM